MYTIYSIYYIHLYMMHSYYVIYVRNPLMKAVQPRSIQKQNSHLLGALGHGVEFCAGAAGLGAWALDFFQQKPSNLIIDIDGCLTPTTIWSFWWGKKTSGWWFQPLWKNINQWEGLSHIWSKIKNMWNHQPDMFQTTGVCLLSPIFTTFTKTSDRRSNHCGHFRGDCWYLLVI